MNAKKAQPVVTAQRDGSAVFCIRESLIAWLTWNVRQKIMDAFGWIFGLMGYVMAFAAWQKIAKLEAELKRRRLLDQDFGQEPEESFGSDPQTWSPEKKARVEAARKKVVVASWKIALFIAIPVIVLVVTLFLRRR